MTTVSTIADSSKNFYHAWLADCVNDITTNASSTTEADSFFRHLATSRIQGASNNDTIKNAFGSEELAWGPAIRTDLQDPSTPSVYTVSNLMYCFQTTDESTAPTYYVGIAGTNLISTL